MRGDRIVLKKNPEYHVKGLPKLDRVMYPVHPRSQRRAGRAQGGRHRRLAVRRSGPEHVAGVQEGRALPGHHGRHHERRDPGDEQREEAVQRRAGPARHHARDQQAGGAEGRDVRDRARCSAATSIRSTRTSSTWRRRCRTTPRKAKKLLAEAGLPERLRDRAEGVAAVLLHGAHGRDAHRAAQEGRRHA